MINYPEQVFEQLFERLSIENNISNKLRMLKIISDKETESEIIDLLVGIVDEEWDYPLEAMLEAGKEKNK